MAHMQTYSQLAFTSKAVDTTVITKKQLSIMVQVLTTGRVLLCKGPVSLILTTICNFDSSVSRLTIKVGWQLKYRTVQLGNSPPLRDEPLNRQHAICLLGSIVREYNVVMLLYRKVMTVQRSACTSDQPRTHQVCCGFEEDSSPFLSKRSSNCTCILFQTMVMQQDKWTRMERQTER